MVFQNSCVEVEKNVQSLVIDDIKSQLSACLGGCTGLHVTLPPGCLVVRARPCDKDLSMENGINVQDLIYPKPDKATRGRLNRDGQPVFYGSFSILPAMFEVENLKAQDDVILTLWRTCTEITLCSLGYTAFTKQSCSDIFDRLKHEQQAMLNLHEPVELNRPKRTEAQAETLEDWVHHVLVRPVAKSDDSYYHLSAAIGEIHVENADRDMDGLLYPSAQVWPQGDNIALFPPVVDRSLRFEKAYHLKAVEQNVHRIVLNCLNHTRSVTPDGSLIWAQSRLSNQAA